MTRFRFVLLTVLLVLVPGPGYDAAAQTCVGLQCQQVGSCPGNATTSVSGIVYAPNGTDPLPNVTVYVPNDVVQPFTAGVSCPSVGAAPSGTPLVGAITGTDGSFTIPNMPVGANIPLVIISGRWRRQLVIPSTASCVNTVLPSVPYTSGGTMPFASMPQNQNQGDIPKIAIATGSADPVECVLLKMGLSASEFTDASGSGRINLFGGGAAGSGVTIDAGTTTQASLMGSSTVLNSYDVLMLPCEGSAYVKPAQELANLINFANAGGRVYSSHFSYDWMDNNPPFNGVAKWTGTTVDLSDGNATVNTGFTAGQTLQSWLGEVGATTTPGQMALQTLREDQTGVIAPTQTWLTLNSPSVAMQFVWDTPIGAANQCGRVLFNEYHVENISAPTFASEVTQCSPTAAMTPQEKLLEYMLFELTSEGGQPSLAPLAQNFGSEAVTFTSAPVTFTWSNNSSFAAQVSSASVGAGDFRLVTDNCSGVTVAGGASCTMVVVFTPSMIGAESGTLTVTAGGFSLVASLTGTGTAGYSLSGNALAFGNLDVGNTAMLSLTLTNIASGTLPIPPFVTTGQYGVSTAACGSSIALGATCPVQVTFLPSGIGPQNGTLGVNSSSLLYNGLTAALTGNGIDFTITLSPTSGAVVAGDGTTTTATLTPLAGFANQVTIGCTVKGASAATCGLPSGNLVPPAAATATLTTTSQYNVIGYGVSGGRGYLWLVALGSGWLLWRQRKRASAMLRAGLLLVLLAAVAGSVTGCSGKLPVANPQYTGPGTYTVTVSATDGFLVRSATYTLTVTAK